MIPHPNDIGEKFGTAIGISQSVGKLAVSSEGADTTTPTTFDVAETVTTFDTLSTTFVKIVKDSGAVYMYDLIDNPYESEDNPSIFAFSQKLTAPGVETGDDYGADIDIVNDIVVIGVTNDSDVKVGGGCVYTYYNENRQHGWELLRYQEPRVAIDALNSAFI